MEKQASIVCLKCGKAITQPVKFCPYCAAALPGTEENGKEEAPQEQEHGYWDFYGMAPEGEEPQPGPVGTRGWLRFIAVCVFVASCALGMALNGWSWGFRWTRAAVIWAVGTGIAILLFIISFFFKKHE
jgi:hypothetical protein